MAILIGLTGPPGVGKDAVARHLENEHGFSRVAFADEIRRIAMVLNPCVGGCARLSEVVHDHGWDVAKQVWPDVRALLQRLGTEVGRQLFGDDIWITKVFDVVDGLPPSQPVVIPDTRFANEAAVIRSRGGYLVRINRATKNPDAVMPHQSEVVSAGLVADYVITNDGTFADLHRRLDQLVPRLQTPRRAHA